MVNYKKFDNTEDVAYNILKALEFCKENKEDGLVFEKSVYRVSSRKASEKFFSISNHTDPGLKRICFLLEDFENFTIDGGESEFVFEDIMIPIALHRCRNVQIKNFEFSAMDTQNAQMRVTDAGADWAEMAVSAGCPCYVVENEVYAGEKEGKHDKLRWFVECDKKSGKLVENAADYFFHMEEYRLTFSQKPDGTIRMEGLNREIPIGNTLVFASKTREVCSILLNESEQITVRNVTLYSGIGMGVLAQNCIGIEIDRLSTRLRGNRKYSINADATHFVHCKGKIHVHDCCFEGQLDDALNAHSIYLKVVEKVGQKIIAGFGHWETVGIDFIKPDSVIHTIDARTQLPKGTFRVKTVKWINLEYMEIEFWEDTSTILVGDLLDEISWKAEVLFENCIVRNNRARGMLLAATGKTVIRNNLFQTPGAAILFQSDGRFWYESGGVEDVLITGNVFENCRYAKWCHAIIEVSPREKTEKDRYYHKKIAVAGNVFKNCTSPVVWLDNTETAEVTENEFENCRNLKVKSTHCKNLKIQEICK